MPTETTVGIDLGTTRSAIAHVVGGEPEIVENAEGESVTPSVVQFDGDGVVVGRQALNSAAMYPDATIQEIKRRMGEDTTVDAAGDTYTPDEVSAHILRKVVGDAEARLERDIGSAVVTVPAYFNARERTATEQAGRIAGLTVERLLPEPSAAALAYGFIKEKLGTEDESELVFVYDLGGGTFDATLVSVNYEFNNFETLHTDGRNDLGGTDWTTAIADWIAETAEDDTGVDVRSDPEQTQRIREAAVEAKHALSSREEYEITIPFLVPDAGYNFSETLSRERFEEMTAELIAQTEEPMDSLFDAADYDVSDVDEVVLVGGATRMPQVEELVAEYFSRPPSKAVNPDEAVALGAAVQAEIIDTGGAEHLLPGGEYGLTVTDVVPQPLGVKVVDGGVSNAYDPIVERDATLPAAAEKRYGVVDENQTRVSIEVYQGEGDTIDDPGLEHIGTAELREVPPREPYEGSLEVRFQVGTDGTLSVEGRDLVSGTTVDARFDDVLGRSAEELRRIRENVQSVGD